METYSVEAYLKATGADKFSQAFNNAAKNVDNLERSTGNAGITIGKLAAAVGVTALVAKGFGMVKNSVDKAFGRIDTMEQFERVMTTMTGSTEKAQSVLEDVNETVTGTAYGLDVGAKAVQDFITSNMDVDKATATFKSWGDAVAFYGDGSNQTLSGVSDALAKATAKGKIQMDTMNRLAEAGIPAMQIYADATGQSVEDVADAMQKGQIKANEFMDIMNDALQNGTENFGSIAGAAKEAGASWGASFDNMQAAVTRGVIAIIQNIDEMLTSNGLPDMREMVATFGKKFEEVLKSVADAIPVVAAGIKRVYDALKQWIPLIGAIAAGFVSYIAIMQGVTAAQRAWDTVQKVSIALTNAQRAAHLAMITSGGGVRGVLLAMRAAMSQLNKTMLLNPWVLAAAAAVAAVILIYKYWEPISGFFIKLWEEIKVAGVAVWDWLKGVWTATVDFFMELWTPIAEFFSNLWLSITTVAIEIFQVYSETLAEIWSSIKNIASAAWELIKNVILGPILLLINLATGDFKEFASNLSQIQNNIRNAASRIWEALKTAVVAAITGLVKVGTILWSNFKETASNIWDSLKTAVVRIIANLVSSAMQKWNDLKSRAIEVIANTVSDLLGKWEELKTKTLDKIKNVKDNVINPLKEIDLKQIGKDIIQGLIDGIKNKVTAVANAVKDVTDKITGKIKGILGIKSPSRVFMGFGENISEGLAIGIDDMARVAERAAQSLGMGVSSAFTPELSLGGIGSQVNAINGQAHRQMQSHLTSELNVGNKQPARIVLQLGNRDFEAFVEDINEVNAINATLRRFN